MKEGSPMRDPSTQELTASEDAPLIAIPVEEDGTTVIRYFTSDDAADRALATPAAVQRALALAGAWEDLDEWDEAEAALDRIGAMREQQNVSLDELIDSGRLERGKIIE